MKNHIGEVFGKLGKYYGIVHAIGCPSHGLLGLALKLGVGLPLVLTAVLKYPHDIITHEVFEPAWSYVLNEKPSERDSCSDHSHNHAPTLEQFAKSFHGHTNSHEDGRAERYAHLTTDITGWGAFGGFIAYKGYKRLRKRNNQEGQVK